MLKFGAKFHELLPAHLCLLSGHHASLHSPLPSTDRRSLFAADSAVPDARACRGSLPANDIIGEITVAPQGFVTVHGQDDIAWTCACFNPRKLRSKCGRNGFARRPAHTQRCGFVPLLHAKECPCEKCFVRIRRVTTAMLARCSGGSNSSGRS